MIRQVFFTELEELLNRVPLFIDYVNKGLVKPEKESLKVESFGQWKGKELREKLLNEIIHYIHDVAPMQKGDSAFYPGEKNLITRRRNQKEGIPVSEEVRKEVNKLLEKH